MYGGSVSAATLTVYRYSKTFRKHPPYSTVLTVESVKVRSSKLLRSVKIFCDANQWIHSMKRMNAAARISSPC